MKIKQSITYYIEHAGKHFTRTWFGQWFECRDWNEDLIEPGLLLDSLEKEFQKCLHSQSS